MPKPFLPAIFQTSAIDYQSVKQFVDISDALKVKVIGSDLESLDTAEKEAKFIDSLKTQIEKYSEFEKVVFYYIGDMETEGDFGQIYLLTVKLGNLIYVIQDHWSASILVENRRCVPENLPMLVDVGYFPRNESYPFHFSIRIFSYPDFEKLTEYGMQGFDDNPLEIKSGIDLFLKEKRPTNFVPCIDSLSDPIRFNILPFDLTELMKSITFFDFCEERRQTSFYPSRENLVLTKEHIKIGINNKGRKAFIIKEVPWPKEMFEGLMIHNIFDQNQIQSAENQIQDDESQYNEILEFIKEEFSSKSAVILFNKLGLSEELTDQEIAAQVNEDVLLDLFYQKCVDVFYDVLFKHIYRTDFGSGFFKERLWSCHERRFDPNLFLDTCHDRYNRPKAPELYKEIISHQIKLSRETAEILWKVSNQQENMNTLKSYLKIAQVKHLQLFLIDFLAENYLESKENNYTFIESCTNLSEILDVLYKFDPDYQNQLLTLSAKIELLESRKAKLHVEDLLVEQNLQDDGAMLVPQLFRAFITGHDRVTYLFHKHHPDCFPKNKPESDSINSVYPRK